MSIKNKKIIFGIIILILSTALPSFGGELLRFDSNNLCITGKVDLPALEIDSINGYDVVESIDCYQSADIGKVSLPVKNLLVLLPPNTDIKDIVITKIEQIEIAGEYTIRPVLPPIPISKAFIRDTISQARYENNGVYPKEILKIGPIEKLHGYSISAISVFCASYNYDTKKLSWNKQIEFQLNLMPKILTQPLKAKAISTTFRGIQEDRKLIEKLVDNPELTSVYGLKRIATLAPDYKYVIITNENLLPAFNRLLDYRINKGISGTIATTQWIYDNYKNGDSQEKIKQFIKDCYYNHNTRYVLLGGDTNIVPYRGVYSKVEDSSLEYIDSDIPCDLYYACLDDNNWTWNADNDKIYGELEDSPDLLPEVWVGRAPVSSTIEAKNFVNKVTTNSQDNIYKELLIGYILWDSPICDGKFIMYDIAEQNPGSYTIYKEYETEEGVNNNRIINYINDGVGLIAHANHTDYYTADPFNIDSEINVRTLSNGTKTFIFNTIGCDAGDFSKEDCIGEEMLLNPNGGAIAFIGNSRYGWFDEYDVKKYSGEYQIEFFKKFLKEGYTTIGETLGISKMKFISQRYNYDPYRWIMLCLNLLGDPIMEFSYQKEIFCIDYIIEKKQDVFELILILKNVTEQEITNVKGTLSTTDNSTIITSPVVASFGTISSGSVTSNSDNPYTIKIDTNYPQRHKIYFDLTITGEGGYKNIDRFSVTIDIPAIDLNYIIPYPNPCYSSKGEVLKINNIPLDSNPTIYIYNLAGELVRKLEQPNEIRNSGKSLSAYWDAKNDKGNKVSSGIYLYILESNLGIKRGKIGIIR